MSRHRTGILIAAVGAVTGTAIASRPWLWLGATRSERHASLPGDGGIARARVVATRAVTIAAPPVEVWPWLAQMGYGRAGWYGYDLWDNAGERSADRLLPDVAPLAVGDVIADAMGPFGFRVVELLPGRAIVFRATIHPVTGKLADPAARPDRPFIDFTWAFLLEALAGGRTRLLVRVRYDHTPRWWVARAVDAYEIVDAIFTRRMLAGIRHRAEAGGAVTEQPAPTAAGTDRVPAAVR